MRSDLTGRNILIVDDEVDIRDFLKWEFEDRGARVFDTGDFEQATRYFEQQRPDFSILDIRMTTGSGVELLSSCKRIHVHLPMALMTGYTEIPGSKIFGSGACDIFVKPLRYEQLFPRIDKEIRSLDERFSTVIGSSEPSAIQVQNLECDDRIRFGSGGFMLRADFKSKPNIGKDYSVQIIEEQGILMGNLKWFRVRSENTIDFGFELLGATENLMGRVVQKLKAATPPAYIPSTLSVD